ncbi:MAG TPA: sulfide/dihydroorotate dehydrogenase-like FAD/NAD-binding protein [Planctomycetota bacterium]|nr:sulfide/dihydroorotate dehydrogenase-like FAD/NAD-binding protein [Planctomycetota bacterium]
MNEIVRKERYSEQVFMMALRAPAVARKAQAGQFIIIRATEEGERIPLTIADFDREKGELAIVVQEIGKSTRLLGTMDVGQAILDVTGPLGVPTHIGKVGTVCCVGGGVGIAAVHPVARAFKEAGSHVVSIIGARNKSLLFWEDQMRAASDELIVTTDDGSYVAKGFVTDRLKEVMARGIQLAEVFAVGPTVMMRAVAETTRPHGIKTVVSLNPIMVDGTGMCGGCRVLVGGKARFACVHGPDFDAHEVDFGNLLSRQRQYLDKEKAAAESFQAATQ